MSQEYTGQGTVWNQGEGHVSIFAVYYAYITAGRWRSINSTSYGTYTAFCNDQTHALNDQIDYHIWLSPGTYTLSEYIATGPDHAINTILLDGVSVGTIDHYTAGNVFCSVKTLANIVVTAPGLHTISFKAASKNGSSSNYYLFFYAFAMWRTA
jgi:hypothetical protein